VPKVGLPDSINGVMAVDWMAHGPVYSGLRTLPVEFGDELVEQFGSNPMWKCDMPGGRSVDELRDFVKVLLARIDQRERCARHYLTRDDFDLLVTVFADPHCVGHQTWHVRDPRHPQYDAAAGAALGDPVLDVYAAIDAAIGRIVDDLDDDTIVLVFSGTGMGPNYTGNHLLDEVLHRLEGRRAAPVARMTRYIKKRVKRILPRDWRRRGQRLKRRIEERTMSADRAARHAFVVPHNDIAGAIRLNIRGREADGRIDPAEVDGYVARLTRELLALRNADTGEQVVESVVRVSDHHQGPSIEALPDLFVLWNRSSPIDRVVSPAVGTVEYVHRGNRTGDHEAESLFFAAGPGVVPGELHGVSLYDFAPTVAAMLGFELNVTDGQPVDALAAPDRKR
jgi:predicted AlkP superfamily phosphohydrolase/phosphomutase